MRKDICEKKDLILEMIKENRPKSEICRLLICKPETLESYLKKWGVDYKGNAPRKGMFHYESRKDISLYLNNEKIISSHTLKNRLINEGYKIYKCENCNLEKWLGSPIPLELHHIDGNRYNNNLDNLQILCPNCHAKTDNYSGRGTLKQKREKKEYRCNCGKNILKESKSCKDCFKNNKISQSKHIDLDVLLVQIRENGYVGTGRIYGVSDNCIRKWVNKKMGYSKGEA